MAKYIHLVRHGEPEEGFTKRFLGRMDPSLSPAGEEQARTLARRVMTLGVRRLVASPLRRAKQTADIIAGIIGVTVEADDRLLEINFGKLEGMTFKEASARYPGTTDSWQALAGDFSFPDGENFRDFDKRCEDIARFALAAPEERIMFVAHGGVLRGVLCHLLAVEADGPLRFRLAYAALTTVETFEGGGAVLTEFNVGRDAP